MTFLTFLVKMAVLAWAMKCVSDVLIAYFNSKSYKEKEALEVEKPKRKIVNELSDKVVNEIHRLRD